jgi:hypothetical protein
LFGFLGDRNQVSETGFHQKIQVMFRGSQAYQMGKPWEKPWEMNMEM